MLRESIVCAAAMLLAVTPAEATVFLLDVKGTLVNDEFSTLIKPIASGCLARLAACFRGNRLRRNFVSIPASLGWLSPRPPAVLQQHIAVG